MHQSLSWTLGLVAEGAIVALLVALTFDSPVSVFILAIFVLAAALASILTWQRQRSR